MIIGRRLSELTNFYSKIFIQDWFNISSSITTANIDQYFRFKISEKTQMQNTFFTKTNALVTLFLIFGTFYNTCTYVRFMLSSKIYNKSTFTKFFFKNMHLWWRKQKKENGSLSLHKTIDFGTKKWTIWQKCWK